MQGFSPQGALRGETDKRQTLERPRRYTIRPARGIAPGIAPRIAVRLSGRMQDEGGRSLSCCC